MKFSLAIGLLLAGLVNAGQLQPKQTVVDSFLRQNQHLKPSAQLVSFKQKGQFYTLTYKDGPANIKYKVHSNKDDMNIVGIQQMISFSNNFSFGPSKKNQQSNTIEIENLGPLPLIMPEFSISPVENTVQTRNVFEVVQSEINEIEKRMQEDRNNFQEVMNNKRKSMQKNFDQIFKKRFAKQISLIGRRDHDFKWTEQSKRTQPMPGSGDHDLIGRYPQQQLIGGGDYDFKQLEPQKLIGGGGHDSQWQSIEITPLIGGGDHDKWVQNNQIDHPLVEGDGHGNRKQSLQKQNDLIGGGDHDTWKNSKKHQKRVGRQHSNTIWMKRGFSIQQVTPYLKSKLPDIMQNSQILTVTNRGHQKGKGFVLEIKLKNKQNQQYQVSALYKPLKKSFLIDRLQKLKNGQNTMRVPVELDQSSKKQEVQKPIENLIAPNFIALNPLLLGGKNDPDHDQKFMMKIASQIQKLQNNHVVAKQIQLNQVPILGGPTDPDRLLKPLNAQKPVSDIQTAPDNEKSDKASTVDSIIESIMDLAKNLKTQQKIQDVGEQAEEKQKMKMKILVK